MSLGDPRRRRSQDAFSLRSGSGLDTDRRCPRKNGGELNSLNVVSSLNKGLMFRTFVVRVIPTPMKPILLTSNNRVEPTANVIAPDGVQADLKYFTYDNFRVLMKYNPSVAYALSIHELAEHLSSQ
eukprot:328790-Pyramimonas_sp.AAC.2